MITKVISYDLHQDDLDYLKERACTCLRLMADCKNQNERQRYWDMFTCYWDLYNENKDKIV